MKKHVRKPAGTYKAPRYAHFAYLDATTIPIVVKPRIGLVPPRLWITTIVDLDTRATLSRWITLGQPAWMGGSGGERPTGKIRVGMRHYGHGRGWSAGAEETR